MVAPLSSARLGSGGISIPVGLDLADLKSKLSEARQTLAAESKNLKAKVDFDMQESAVLRQVRAVIRKIENESVKIQVGVRLQQLGLAPAPAVTQSAAMDVNPADVGIHGPAVRGRFGGFESEVRGAMASRLRKIRRDTRDYEVKRAADDQLFGEQGEGDPSRPAVGRGSAGGLRGLMRGGAWGYAAHFAGQLANASIGIGQGAGMGMSADPVLSAQGKLSTIQGLSSIPVIGGLFSAFDKLTGASEALNEKIKTRLALEGFGVASAQVGGDQFSIAKAETAKQHIDLVREREQIEIRGDQALEFAEKVDKVFGDGLAKKSKARTGGLLAGKDEEIANLAKLGNTRLQLLRFDSDTRTGLSEMRVRNRGLHLDDEDALSAIRGVDANIRRATSKEGKHRAALEGLSSLRAFKSGLEVRGGGFGAVTNLQTDLVGDPFNLNPETQARIRAGRMADTALGKLGALSMPGNPALGSARARNMGLDFSSMDNPGGVKNEDTDLAAESLSTLGQILDLLQNLKLNLN